MLEPIPPWHFGIYGSGSVPSPTPEPDLTYPIKPKVNWVAVDRGVSYIGSFQRRAVQFQNINNDVMDLNFIFFDTVSWRVKWTISDGSSSGFYFDVHSINNFSDQLPAISGIMPGTIWLEFEFVYTGSFADPTDLVAIQATCKGHASTASVIATYHDHI